MIGSLLQSLYLLHSYGMIKNALVAVINSIINHSMTRVAYLTYQHESGFKNTSITTLHARIKSTLMARQYHFGKANSSFMIRAINHKEKFSYNDTILVLAIIFHDRFHCLWPEKQKCLFTRKIH